MVKSPAHELKFYMVAISKLALTKLSSPQFVNILHYWCPEVFKQLCMPCFMPGNKLNVVRTMRNTRWLHREVKPSSHIFACIALWLKVHVNACCNTRIEKKIHSYIALHCNTHLNHFICTSSHNTTHKQKRCELGLRAPVLLSASSRLILKTSCVDFGIN